MDQEEIRNQKNPDSQPKKSSPNWLIGVVLLLAVAVVVLVVLLITNGINASGSKETEKDTTAKLEASTDTLDYENTDLSQYITLGPYQGQTFDVNYSTGIKKELDELFADANHITDRLTVADEKACIDFYGFFAVADDTVAATGHTAFLTYTAKIDGAVVDSLCKADTYLVLASDEFSKAIIGKKAGNEFTVSVTYASDNKDTTIAGKTVEYSGKINRLGTAFSQGSATKQSIILNDKESGYITGFATAIVGHMPGTFFDINVTFPSDYGNTTLNGKSVVFHITLHYIMEDYKGTEEGAIALIKEYTENKADSLESFRTYYLEKSGATDRQNAAFEALVKNATIKKLPDESVSYYYSSMVSYYTYYASMYGVTYENFLAQYVGTTDAELKKQAEDYTRSDLVYYQILKEQKIAVTDEIYTERLRKYCEENLKDMNESLMSSGTIKAEMTLDEAIAYMDKNNKDSLKQQFRSEMFYEYLEKNNTFHEVTE